MSNGATLADVDTGIETLSTQERTRKSKQPNKNQGLLKLRRDWKTTLPQFKRVTIIL